MCSIELVRLYVRPSFCSVEYKLRTIHLPEGRPEFLICGLEVLGLGPEPDPFQIGFFVCF
jgi:hypothetical protein